MPKPKPKPKPKTVTPDEKLKKDSQKDIKEQLPKNTVAFADVNKQCKRVETLFPRLPAG